MVHDTNLPSNKWATEKQKPNHTNTIGPQYPHHQTLPVLAHEHMLPKFLPRNHFHKESFTLSIKCSTKRDPSTKIISLDELSGYSIVSTRHQLCVKPNNIYHTHHISRNRFMSNLLNFIHIQKTILVNNKIHFSYEKKTMPYQ